MSHLWLSSPHRLWARCELEMKIPQASSFLYILVGESSSFIDEIHAEGLPLPAETLELSVCAGGWSEPVESGCWWWPCTAAGSTLCCCSCPLPRSCISAKKHHHPWAWLYLQPYPVHGDSAFPKQAGHGMLSLILYPC